MGAISEVVLASFARISIPRAPWPTAWRKPGVERREVMRCERFRRSSPAVARMRQEYLPSGASSLARRLSLLLEK